jgi:hypothetical protein
MNMIGTSRVRRACFKRLQTSNPSIPGILTSSRIRLGGLASAKPHPIALLFEQLGQQSQIGGLVIDNEDVFVSVHSTTSAAL